MPYFMINSNQFYDQNSNRNKKKKKKKLIAENRRNFNDLAVIIGDPRKMKTKMQLIATPYPEALMITDSPK